MITIIISACLISDPDVCRDHRMPLTGNFDPNQCAVSALPHFGRWASENPGWEIKRWRCSAGGAEDI